MLQWGWCEVSKYYQDWDATYSSMHARPAGTAKISE